MRTGAKRNTFKDQANPTTRESNHSTIKLSLIGILYKSVEYISNKTEEQMLQFGNWFYTMSDDFFRDEKTTR